MKNELKAYIEKMSALIESGNITKEQLNSMLVSIGFFQHERLIHLLVTLAFAVMTILSLLMTVQEFYFIPLFVLFLALEVPYVFHYYRLENGVQKLQRMYREAEEKVKK
ncbi:MAG: hypothetical protein J1F60_07590 [Oscillospiraceae bacterium]|nr:hypothetical protein [Oscillospiraceae bacterium]